MLKFYLLCFSFLLFVPHEILCIGAGAIPVEITGKSGTGNGGFRIGALQCGQQQCKVRDDLLMTRVMGHYVA